MEITTIGIDLAKHVFQVHAVDASGGIVVRKACGTSHPWARELVALGIR